MTVFQTIALLLTAAAAGACFNYKFLQLPATIGMMTFAMLVSFVGIILNHFGLINLSGASSFVNSLDFSNILLHGLLSFLLFAGALNIDLADLKRHRVIVAVLATVSVLIATFVTGGLVWLAAGWLGLHFSLIEALLFGALISPTDPVAVMGILKHTKMSADLRVKIGSESLLNDGVGVVVFMTLLSIAQNPHMAIVPSHIVMMVAWEGIGGILMGVALGWLALQILMRIDDYKVEVLVTLALAAGGYCISELAFVSAPVAMVGAGLVIGNHGRILGMSNRTRKHVDMFWELIDEILNAILFMLIGLEMIVITVTPAQMPIGLVAIAAVLAGRYVSVVIPIGLMRSRYGFVRGTVALLTWGGLRGGISIALALSLPPGPNKNLILAMTYVTVVFSVLVQGTTFRSVARAVIGQKDDQATRE